MNLTVVENGKRSCCSFPISFNYGDALSVEMGDLPNTAAVVSRSSAAAFLPGQTAQALQFPEAAPGTVSNISSGFNLTT